MTDLTPADLLDRAAILDVYARYALGMDRADRSMFASVWSADAVWTCAELGLRAEGHDAIMEFFDGRYGKGPTLPDAGGNLRLAGNHLIEISGDRATGRAETVSFRYMGGAMHPYTVGYYDDEFVRTGGGWRLSSRDMVVAPIAKAP